MLLWYWNILLRSSTERTRARAAVQDPGRDAVFIVTLIAVAFGFVAAFAILGRNPNDHIPKHAAALYALGFGAVVLGWTSDSHQLLIPLRPPLLSRSGSE